MIFRSLPQVSPESAQAPTQNAQLPGYLLHLAVPWRDPAGIARRAAVDSRYLDCDMLAPIHHVPC